MKNKSTISDIKSFKSFKRNRGSNYEDLDKGLYLWFESVRRNGADVTGPILKAKAIDFAKQLNVEKFKSSNGFFSRFVKRHKIKFQH